MADGLCPSCRKHRFTIKDEEIQIQAQCDTDKPEQTLGGTQVMNEHGEGETTEASDRDGSVQAPPAQVETRTVQIGSSNIFTNSIGMQFRLIHPGKFMMGDDSNGPLSPPREVTITKPFWLGIFPVTQEEYATIGKYAEEIGIQVGINSGNGIYPSTHTGSMAMPVNGITWYEAVEFCNILSRRENDSPHYKYDDFRRFFRSTHVSITGGTGYRLPTEAEWEYACRAGTTGPFSFSSNPRSFERDADKYAWFNLNSNGTSHPVGQKLPNPWGLYDMHGNVYEWCWDRYGNFTQDPVIDPAGSSSGYCRVVRGGSCTDSGTYIRSGRRHDHAEPGGRPYIYSAGMRVAIDLLPERSL